MHCFSAIANRTLSLLDKYLPARYARLDHAFGVAHTFSLRPSHVRRPQLRILLTMHCFSAIANRTLSLLDKHLPARYARLDHAFGVAHTLSFRPSHVRRPQLRILITMRCFSAIANHTLSLLDKHLPVRYARLDHAFGVAHTLSFRPSHVYTSHYALF